MTLFVDIHVRPPTTGKIIKERKNTTGIFNDNVRIMRSYIVSISLHSGNSFPPCSFILLIYCHLVVSGLVRWSELFSHKLYLSNREPPPPPCTVPHPRLAGPLLLMMMLVRLCNGSYKLEVTFLCSFFHSRVGIFLSSSK